MSQARSRQLRLRIEAARSTLQELTGEPRPRARTVRMMLRAPEEERRDDARHAAALMRYLRSLEPLHRRAHRREARAERRRREEAMASGVPVLLAADGEAARIVRKTGAGLTVKPGDIHGLMSGVRRIAADASLRRGMGHAGRRAAETLFDRSRIAEDFEALLRSSE